LWNKTIRDDTHALGVSICHHSAWTIGIRAGTSQFLVFFSCGGIRQRQQSPVRISSVLVFRLFPPTSTGNFRCVFLLYEFLCSFCDIEADDSPFVKHEKEEKKHSTKHKQGHENPPQMKKSIVLREVSEGKVEKFSFKRAISIKNQLKSSGFVEG
jgi:hypothetical protein